MARWSNRWFVLLLVLCTGCDTRQDEGKTGGNSPLSDQDIAGFARAFAPRIFSFPADHDAHREFRHEWWYVTGNLDGDHGRRFGFQITFFRYGLTARPAPRSSRWAASEIHMAHFALTDLANQRFRAFERRARAAQGLAGVRMAPFRVWLEDWRLETKQGNDFPWTLTAREGEDALSLTLRTTKPMVLQGEAGLSQKSARPGNASYYYSGTRLAAEGEVETGGETIPVKGLAWLDREWSTSALAPDQVGWDWFSLQFHDGTELMYYRLRLKDGTSDPHSAGSFVDAHGTKIPLNRADVEFRVLDRWRAPGGAFYPARWQMTVKPLNKHLIIEPVMADQELRGGALRYWEGAVDVFSLDRPGQPVGRGYMELTGYAGRVEPDAGR